MKKEAEICPKCGVRQKNPPIKNKRNRIVAGLLAILLGGIGAHKFYLGHIGTGLLYFVFCWTLIPAIIAFFEGIFFFMASDQAFNAKYS
ncbi:MAG: TM2 domain-containing protein [Candidatus Aenigmarchaeota archaeon]|nr:TM2 domain-containing protein [Candidatus Aenigmarchaeota archaeon]